MTTALGFALDRFQRSASIRRLAAGALGAGAGGDQRILTVILAR